MRTTTVWTLGVLMLGLTLGTGCGPGEDCQQLCRTVVDDCGIRAWTDDGQCAEGCDDELFKHPRRLEVIDCYQEAADACDIESLISCRHLGDQLGVETSGD